jgi:hypothetical protein
MAQDQAFNASNAGDTTAGASSEAHQLLEGFWPKVVEDIKTLVPNDFKTQELPLARIKKIMKLDDDVKSMVSLIFQTMSLFTTSFDKNPNNSISLSNR